MKETPFEGVRLTGIMASSFCREYKMNNEFINSANGNSAFLTGGREGLKTFDNLHVFLIYWRVEEGLRLCHTQPTQNPFLSKFSDLYYIQQIFVNKFYRNQKPSKTKNKINLTVLLMI